MSLEVVFDAKLRFPHDRGEGMSFRYIVRLPALILAVGAASLLIGLAAPPG
jgi:hypothetical protein